MAARLPTVLQLTFAGVARNEARHGCLNRWDTGSFGASDGGAVFRTRLRSLGNVTETFGGSRPDFRERRLARRRAEGAVGCRIADTREVNGGASIFVSEDEGQTGSGTGAGIIQTERIDAAFGRTPVDGVRSADVRGAAWLGGSAG